MLRDALGPGVWCVELELIREAGVEQVSIDESDAEGAGSGSASEVHGDSRATDAAFGGGDCEYF